MEISVCTSRLFPKQIQVCASECPPPSPVHTWCLASFVFAKITPELRAALYIDFSPSNVP